MQYAVRTPTVGAEDGRWSITANTFVLSVDRVSQRHPNTRTSSSCPRMPCGLSGEAGTRLHFTIGVDPRFYCALVMLRQVLRVLVYRREFAIRAKCVLRRFQRGLAPVARRSIPNDATAWCVGQVPELWDYLFAVNVTYKFQSFPGIFFVMRNVIISATVAVVK